MGTLIELYGGPLDGAVINVDVYNDTGKIEPIYIQDGYTYKQQFILGLPVKNFSNGAYRFYYDANND